MLTPQPRLLARTALILAIGLSACSSSNDSHPQGTIPDDHPAPSPEGGATEGGAIEGGAADGGGDSGAPSGDLVQEAGDALSADGGDEGASVNPADAGAPADAATDAEPDALLPAEAASDPPPIDGGPGVCSLALTVGTATQLASARTPLADRLGAITPDELTIAWMSVSGSNYEIEYADRDSSDVPFLPAVPVDLAGGYYANDRIALSPDGLRIIVVRSDRKALGEFVRTARKHSFTTAASEASFASINNLGLMLPADEYFGDPVVASNDQTLFFSRYGGTLTHTIYESRRAPGVGWPLGVPHSESSLSQGEGQRRRPTGISSDLRTLFYFDEPTEKESVAFRATVDNVFDRFVSLGSQGEAQPNLACSRIYFSDQENAVLKNFTAPLQ